MPRLAAAPCVTAALLTARDAEQLLSSAWWQKHRAGDLARVWSNHGKRAGGMALFRSQAGASRGSECQAAALRTMLKQLRVQEAQCVEAVAVQLRAKETSGGQLAGLGDTPAGRVADVTGTEFSQITCKAVDNGACPFFQLTVSCLVRTRCTHL